MNCVCSVDVDLGSDGLATMSECKIRIARVSHKCNECQDRIEIGEKYEHYKGMHDGEFFTHKTCSDCLSIRDVFFANGYYFGAVLEYFYEFIDENRGQISEKCLSALTPRAREIVCERIQEIWFELSLEFPTDPAFRLKKRFERLRYRNGWEMQRDIEIGKMDSAVWDAIDKARKAGLPSK